MKYKTWMMIGFSLLLVISSLNLWHYTSQEPKKSKTEVINYVDDYPSIWKDAPISSMNDSWMSGNRQCTSWVAFKVWQTYGYSTYGWGDAYVWIKSATARGVPFGDEPRVASAAVDTRTIPGHIMWVQKINDDGTINVSEYNRQPGKFSMTDVPTEGLKFIYFDQVQPNHRIN